MATPNQLTVPAVGPIIEKGRKPTLVYSNHHLNPDNPTKDPAANSITRLKRVIFGTFPEQREEDLYQEYMRKQKLKIIPAFVVVTIIYLLSHLGLDAVLPDDGVHMTRVGIYALFILLIIVVLGMLTYIPSMSKRSSNLCVISLWVLVMSSLLVDVAVHNHPLSPSGLVGWVQVLIFTTFVVLPWKLRHCVGMSVIIAVVHSVELFLLWFARQHFTKKEDETLQEEKNTIHTMLAEELVADTLLFSGAISLGVLVFAFSERKQRRSFLESKKSHAISYEIEKQHKKQRRLLQSVLPKYVARLMMWDMEGMENTGDNQFRKIYMQRFDDVSILFADIVGFTAISSSVSAGELVKILNQLFANFDSLGYKYHQQRIKILGDCYYCVCGISKVEVRPDHAVLCIHMGMSMVDAIRDVRNKTGKDVNMRVGIHTGSVLAGVMGQKQWQYDVLGQQVLLANHMESGGLPARVHISNATKSELNGQFELEAGNGKNRDDYLKLENMSTYLVKSIILPYPQGTLDVDPNLLRKKKEEAATLRGEIEDTRSLSEAYSEECSEEMTMSTHLTLKDALFNKARSRTAMEKLNFFTTWFHDSSTETRYRKRRENFSGASMGALGLILILASMAKFAVLPITWISVLVFLVAEVILMSMALVSAAEGMIKAKWLPQSIKTLGSTIERHRISRMLWGLGAIMVLIAADAANIMQCDIARAKEGLENNTNIHVEDQSDPVCTVPAYFVHGVHLILLGVSSMVQIEHITKLVVILVSSSVYATCYILVFGPVFDYNDVAIHLDKDKAVSSKYDLSVKLLSAAFALLIINRKMEEISRRLFIWKEEAQEKTDVAFTERNKTEGLIFNILPEHVAKYFTGQHRDSMDLYHHGYDNVSVMFAACSNFHDFYNETDINNQGLECLRLLNEIISDYDELLDKPRFKTSITKIKTVGPTYMAASGMIDSPQQQEDICVSKFQHVDDLVQFALAMKDKLRLINEHSFNSFLLRIGINHGPIIAGVIGVTKPHYDIWGNTVNVASRMESTGLADHIQVVEQTKVVLEQFGYFFQKRGRIHVKGKGELTTFFLIGQDKDAPKKPCKKKRSHTKQFMHSEVDPIIKERPTKSYLDFSGYSMSEYSRSHDITQPSTMADHPQIDHKLAPSQIAPGSSTTLNGKDICKESSGLKTNEVEVVVKTPSPLAPSPTSPPIAPKPSPSPLALVHPISPEPSSPVSPKPSSPVSTEPSSPVSTEPSSLVSPEPSSPVSTEPSSPVSPESSSPVSPKPSSTASFHQAVAAVHGYLTKSESILTDKDTYSLMDKTAAYILPLVHKLSGSPQQQSTTYSSTSTSTSTSRLDINW